MEETNNTGEKGKKLDAFRIVGLPPDFYYMPDFITVEEEMSILSKIPANRWTHLTHRRLQAIPSTLTKSNTLLVAASLPVYLTHPVVERFEEYGIFAQNNTTTPTTPTTPSTSHGQPNHVLVNEYRAGEGIMPHEDGDAYAPVVATVSLGSGLCLDVLPARKKKESGDAHPHDNNNDEDSGDGNEAEAEPEYTLPARIFQEPRSLLVTTGRAYREVLHGIAPIEVDEGLLGESSVANWSLLGDLTREGLVGSGGRNVRGTRVSLTYRDVLKVSAGATRVFGGLGRK
ncbi:alkB alkylation repair 6 [Pyrenophora seminiperda CCB06]|uniref:AlkB alkylation repair 6 n=1 Tax=Pyrenophora seminiperda CCB06 TaxID=1302712 RepID=A0A3M7M619_9PLEO|nr:alkB alkylation repair 6 [Pyrenophora seminiperda CCB06]